MSHDSQRLEIEHVQRKLADWLSDQPGIDQLRACFVSDWLHPVIQQLETDANSLLMQLDQHPGAEGMRSLMAEEVFGLPTADGSFYEHFAKGAGRGENGLRLRYLRRLAMTAPSAWKVVRVNPGISVTLTSLDETETVVVHDRMKTRDLESNDVLLTRLIDMPAGHMLSEGVVKIKDVSREIIPDTADEAVFLMNVFTLGLLMSPAQAAAAESEFRAGAGNFAGAGSSQNDKDSVDPGDNDGASHRKANPSVDSAHEKVLERVRKLFALAQETEASPHEAEIALRRCQSLMSKYGITEADLETSAFGHAEITTGRTVPMHMKYLASAVSRLHDVLFVSGRAGFAEFRGFEVDASVARLTLDYLLDAVERSLAVRKRSGDFPAGRSAAYDYRLAFAYEVDRRVSELVAERLQEERKKAGSGTSLVVRKREIVKRECSDDLASSTFRGREARNARARAAGENDGARVSLEHQVTSAPEPLALAED